MPARGEAALDPAHTADIVRGAWAAALRLSHFGPEDDFFALGGDSVAAALVALRVARRAGIAVPPRALFEYPAFAAFADFVQAQRQPAPAAGPRADPATHPLTPGQERLWLISQLYPDQPRYTVATIVNLAGKLDVDALSAALSGLVARHEPLRTVVDDSGARAVCRVLDPGPVRIDAESVADEQHARERAAEFLRRPFALSTQIPVRVLLLCLGTARHWLVLAVHHIATDGDSQRILLAELGQLYNAALAGVPAALTPLTAAYGDLAAWHAARAADLPARRRDRQIRKLDGYQDRPLALEGPDPGACTGSGARCCGWLGGRLTESVRACASRHRTTAFVVMLAGFADIAARWSGSDDVCVGFPVSRREQWQAGGIAGFFVDTCLIRADLSGRPSFAALVDRVRSDVVDAVLDAGPFDALADGAAAGQGRGTPVFRAWFNYLGDAIRPPEMTGLTATLPDVPAPPALFDLNVYVTEHDADIRVELVYDVAACSDDAAAEVLEQYLTLLAAVVAAPAAPLRRHGRATRRAALLPDPGDPLGTPPPAALARRLLSVARSRGGSAALRDADGQTSFTQLRAAVRALAGVLRTAGAGPGHTVAVHGARDAATVTAMLGVLASGARLLMLDPAYPAARLVRYMDAGQAQCLVSCGAQDPGLPARTLIRFDHGTALLARTSGGLTATADEGPGYLAFTSGSGGEPTVVRGGLRAVEHFLHWYSAEYRLGPRDRFALLAGLAHDPVFRDVLLPLWNGGTLCIPAPEVFRAPDELARWLRGERISVVNLTPPLARLLAAQGVPLPGLRLACLAGDAVSTADVERMTAVAPGAVLLNGYGTTETPQLVSRRRLLAGRPPALGAGAPGSQLLVLDAAGELCGIGEAGSIVVRSRHLADEIRPGGGATPAPAAGQPAQNGQLLSRDRLPGIRRFVTGDLGRYQTDGSVAFLGRADGVVSVRGFRVHPAETDRALASVPGVSASVTVPWTGPDGPALASYVVGPDPVPATIRARLAALLPAPLVPERIIRVDRLPLTPNGKIDRAALPAATAARAARADAAGAAGSLEGRLARLWSVVLGIERVDVTASFFDLGGTSLSMLRLHSAIRRELGDQVPLLALYENPSVRAMARSLSRLAVAPVQADTSRMSRVGERSRRLAARGRRAAQAQARPDE